MECCVGPVVRDRIPAMPPQPPLPQASGELITLPAQPALTSTQQQRFKLKEEAEIASSNRVLTLLEAILEEQAGLRGVIGQLEQGLSGKLDDLRDSVALGNASSPFQVGTFFQDAADHDLANPESAEHAELEVEATKWFSCIDKDKSGSLTNAELKAYLHRWSLSAKQSFKEEFNITSEEDLDAMIVAADTNEDGEIDKDEFVQMLLARKLECRNKMASDTNPGFELAQSRSSFAIDSRTFMVEQFVTNFYFETAITVVILVNMATMCTHLQYKGQNHGSNLGLRHADEGWAAMDARLSFLELLFNVIYLIEIILRLWVRLFRREIKAMDIVDTVAVGSACLDTFVFQPLNYNFVNLSVLRLIRLSRLFKLVRYSEHLSEMRVLINTLLHAVRGIVWSVVLLGSIISAGGIMMAQLSIPFLEDDSIELSRRQWLYEHFGTTTNAIYTMFEATFTGGWRFLSRPLINEVHYFFAVFWVIWILLVNFVTMRVVGALFLQQTMKVSAQDAERCAMNQLQRKGELSDNLKMIFRQADTSGDGAISQEEFDAMMSHRGVVAEFEKMGLDVEEVGQFFSVLVADDGTADYNEFINGALAMASSAPAIDMMKQLQHDIKVEEGLQQILEAVLPLSKLLSPQRQDAKQKLN